MNDTFLRVSKNTIVDGKGQKVRLKGVNFGGWLMMEGAAGTYWTFTSVKVMLRVRLVPPKRNAK